jgi:hypothetical protein
MLRTQYKFPWLRSYLGAYHAAIRRTGDIELDVPYAAQIDNLLQGCYRSLKRVIQ